MKKFSRLTGWILFCLLISLTAGCTYESGPKTLSGNIKPDYAINPAAPLIIEKAIEYTDTKGEKFWYTGWIVTKVQKRRTTSMYDGTFVRDKGYLVKARVMGQDFRYYRHGDDVYVSEGDNWIKAPSAQYPPDPFDGFRSIIPYTNKARQLPDEQVLGRDCFVFEIDLSGEDIKGISVKLAQDNKVQDFLLDGLEMKYRIWIGKKDSFIYQLKTESTMPVPRAGTMYQEVYFRFWDYNSESINLTEPEQIIKYLKE